MSRYRLQPTPAQEAALAEHCGHARFVWNLAVEQHAHWRPGRKGAPGFAEQCRQLTEARAANPWPAAGSVTVQQQALRDFAQAMGMRSYRVTRDRAGRWHVAFAAIPEPIPGPGTGEVVGVDRGVSVSAALSTGELLNAPGLRESEKTRLRRLERELARAERGSTRRGKIKAAIARLKAREADRRKDWVEKTSTDLARRFDVIAVEDLDIGDMTRSARGTVEAPGRNVRQKAGLNRGILAAGWGWLVTRLEHKAPGRVRKIDPCYTSQTCNACKHVARESRESQALFLCVACGHRANADVNAACNMRDTAAGHAVAARGRSGLPGRMNREPQPVLLPA